MGFRAAHILANHLWETAGKHTYVISSPGLPLAVGSGLTWVVGDEPGATSWAQHSREESFLWGWNQLMVQVGSGLRFSVTTVCLAHSQTSMAGVGRKD